MHLGRGYPAYQCHMENTPLSATEAGIDLGMCYQTTSESQIYGNHSGWIKLISSRNKTRLKKMMIVMVMNLCTQ